MSASLPGWLSLVLSWELLAVLLAVAYPLLAVREKILCWYAAFVSSAIYVALFWQASLPMQALLSVYYVGMAVYGWWNWKFGGAGEDALPIRSWPLRQHLTVAAGIVALTAVSGYWLAANTESAWPYVDSFLTWASIVTTWMVAHKILENWLYWVVINSASAVLYLDRELYLTALLFVAYVVIVLFGYLSWRKRLDATCAATG